MQKIFGRAVQPLLPQKVLSVAIVTVAFCICAAAFPEISKAEDGDKQPAEVFTHKVEKKLLPLPDCKDAVLLGAVKDFVAGFYAGNADKNAAFRRRRHFITHNLAEFSRENIANYKTEAARPVSDIIIDLKVNKNILEENMLLCKNQSPYKNPGNVYILVYPEDDGYKVHLINLDAKGEDVSFFYKKA